jgi:hypothetical protein
MTRDDVLKEFVDCQCRYVCDCYEFVYQAMADEIVSLRAERDALRALAVQPWKHIEPRDSFEIEWTILP